MHLDAKLEDLVTQWIDGLQKKDVAPERMDGLLDAILSIPARSERGSRDKIAAAFACAAITLGRDHPVYELLNSAMHDRIALGDG